MDKTNVMRVLQQKKIPFKEYFYGDTNAKNGVEIATLMGENIETVFKTLVTVGKTGEHYVFMVPVAEELDLKKGAKIVGEKFIEMVPQKELLPLTGYVHGGCSPIGMKKQYKLFIHKSANNNETIVFSGGKVGYQVEISIVDLKRILGFSFADVIK